MLRKMNNLKVGDWLLGRNLFILVFLEIGELEERCFFYVFNSLIMKIILRYFQNNLNLEGSFILIQSSILNEAYELLHVNLTLIEFSYHICNIYR